MFKNHIKYNYAIANSFGYSVALSLPLPLPAMFLPRFLYTNGRVNTLRCCSLGRFHGVVAHRSWSFKSEFFLICRSSRAQLFCNTTSRDFCKQPLFLLMTMLRDVASLCGAADGRPDNIVTALTQNVP